MLLLVQTSSAGEIFSARCLRTNTTISANTHPQYTCTHARTHVRAQHRREWVRSEGQTPSMRHITATTVGLTSTSRAPASPKPRRPSLAALIASHPCDTTHTHTKWREKKEEEQRENAATQEISHCISITTSSQQWATNTSSHPPLAALHTTNYNTLQRKHHGFAHEKINISSTKTHTDILKGGI